MHSASRETRPLQAHRLLFVAAALQAAIIVPLWTLAYAGRLGLPLPPLWHGHEMIFGFALAVVGGYLVTRASWPSILLAVALWAIGRVAALADWPAPLMLAASLAYPICLFVLAGLPLLRAAKRWRNLIFAPILGAFVLAELVFQAGAAGLIEDGRVRGLSFALHVVALLMFVMGGRVIAAAASGAQQRAGAAHRDMAQVRVEVAGVACLAVAALASLAGAPLASGIAAALGALAAARRLARWRLWLLRRQVDVALLGIGYAWLAVGLALLAATALAGLAWPDALHGIAAGAIGTLTATMMLRVALQRARQPIALAPPHVAAVLLVNLAAVARLAPLALAAWRLPLLEIAALSWCGGFLVVAVEVWRRPPR